MTRRMRLRASSALMPAAIIDDDGDFSFEIAAPGFVLQRNRSRGPRKTSLPPYQRSSRSGSGIRATRPAHQSDVIHRRNRPPIGATRRDYVQAEPSGDAPAAERRGCGFAFVAARAGSCHCSRLPRPSGGRAVPRVRSSSAACIVGTSGPECAPIRDRQTRQRRTTITAVAHGRQVHSFDFKASF